VLLKDLNPFMFFVERHPGLEVNRNVNVSEAISTLEETSENSNALDRIQVVWTRIDSLNAIHEFH
jgi:hypothetical protein